MRTRRISSTTVTHEITFFTFGIDAMGRLSESALSFMRSITNCLEDTPCEHAAFLHYWSRRLVVAFMAAQIDAASPCQPERPRPMLLLCL